MTGRITAGYGMSRKRPMRKFYRRCSKCNKKFLRKGKMERLCPKCYVKAIQEGNAKRMTALRKAKELAMIIKLNKQGG